MGSTPLWLIGEAPEDFEHDSNLVGDASNETRRKSPSTTGIGRGGNLHAKL
jgi:hypothetical protein